MGADAEEGPEPGVEGEGGGVEGGEGVDLPGLGGVGDEVVVDEEEEQEEGGDVEGKGEDGGGDGGGEPDHVGAAQALEGEESEEADEAEVGEEESATGVGEFHGGGFGRDGEWGDSFRKGNGRREERRTSNAQC